MIIETERLVQAHMRRYHKGSDTMAFGESDSDDEELAESHSENEPMNNVSNDLYVLLSVVRKGCLTR